MRTKMNNKGYTLVELMLTLFIFGIVMVGIGMIMRTTSVSYKGGNAEVTMQTEAQIIANQVEELLVDATAVSGKITLDANRYYYSVESNGAAHYIMFNGTDNRMYYQQDAIVDKPENWMLMAEYVSSFSINGLTTDKDSADCDNMVTVKIDMDKSGYNYTSVKEVYFRNDIENKSVQLIGGAAPAPEESDDGFTGTIVVDRYQIIDLEKEYNIKTGTVTFSSNFGTYYRFLDATYNTDNKYANKLYVTSGTDKIETSVDDSDNPKATAFLSSNISLNDDFGKTIADDGTYWIAGKTHDDKDVKYKLSTPAVSYKIDKSGGSGALLLSQNDNDDGRDGWVEVEGINFCHMVEYPVGGVSMQLNYEITLYDDSLGTVENTYDSESERNFQYGNNSNEYRTAKIASGALTTADTITTHELVDMPAKCKIGVRIDPLTGDLSIVQANDPMGIFKVRRKDPVTGNMVDVNISESGDVRVACAITVSKKDTTTTATPTVIDMGVVVQGNNSTFTNYSGGNTYSATTSLWD